MWMHRFDGWDRPTLLIGQSGQFMDEFHAMTQARVEADARLQAWVARLDPVWLAGGEIWFSGAEQQGVTRPRTLLGVRPWRWTESSFCFDPLPGVLILELRWAEIPEC